MTENQPIDGVQWDLTGYFPEFDGPVFKQHKADLERDVAALRETAERLPALDADNQDDWEAVVLQIENLEKRFSHLASYVGCLCSADARNEDYQREEAALSLTGAAFTKLGLQLLRAVKEAPTELYETFCAREALADVGYALGRIKEEAERTMSPEKEVLATDLRVDGMGAWGRLYNRLSGKLEFDMTYPDGRTERVPMAQRRGLLDDPDRAVRQAAFDGGNKTWEQIEDVAAAALNHICGTRLTLNRHRGVDHFLDIALFQSAISRKTLDAMFEAIYANAELARRALRLKAKTLKLDPEAVAWCDLLAPLPLPDQENLAWAQGCQLVEDAFAEAYPSLADYFRGMLEKRWIESEPRAGKRPGGFCTHSLQSGEARIFMTFKGTVGDVRTLAHEVGHAFHAHVTRDLRPFAQEYPMTLAETASTFGELILTDGVVENPAMSDAQKATMLDIEAGHGAMFLLDIPTRFEFEKSLHEERAKGELSVSRLKELMVETQQRIFGDVLDPAGVDPYFWASKLHFYITGVTFYNFPYTFGYLLSRGLYAQYKKEGPDFLPRYEEFLRLTGNDTAENVAMRSIGHDLTTPEFWAESINSLELPMRRLEALLPSVLPQEA